MNKDAPQKEKYVRGNQSHFMTKTLTKAIMQIEIIYFSKETYVLHICEKVKESFVGV